MEDAPNLGETAEDNQKKRIEAFNSGLRELVKKTEIDISAQPQIQDGRIIASPILVDMKEVNKKLQEAKDKKNEDEAGAKK